MFYSFYHAYHFHFTLFNVNALSHATGYVYYVSNHKRTQFMWPLIVFIVFSSSLFRSRTHVLVSKIEKKGREKKTIGTGHSRTHCVTIACLRQSKPTLCERNGEFFYSFSEFKCLESFIIDRKYFFGLHKLSHQIDTSFHFGLYFPRSLIATCHIQTCFFTLGHWIFFWVLYGRIFYAYQYKISLSIDFFFSSIPFTFFFFAAWKSVARSFPILFVVRLQALSFFLDN